MKRLSIVLVSVWWMAACTGQREDAHVVAPAPVTPSTPAPQAPPVTPPAAPPVAEIAAPAPTPAAVERVEPPPGSEPAPPPSPAPPIDPMAVYTGTHKLGVNRVTDMARVGSATFSRRDGALYLEGRVERGKHWFALSGRVEPKGPDSFDLHGTIRGVPDMAWNNEAPRERTTEGRFTFKVTKRRPYWRLYEVNGRDCVCWDNCGNDFCYVDIEQRP